MSEDKYEDKIVIWLDILKFKEAIKCTLEPEQNYTVGSIKNIFDEIDKIINEFLDVSYTIRFSDTILIVALPKFESAHYRAIKKIHIYLLNHNLLLRGAMVKGKVYFSRKEDTPNATVFGPAINKAYYIEQQAIYPRVIVDRSITEEIMDTIGSPIEINTGKFLDNILYIKDFDGFYFVDYFKAIHKIDDNIKREKLIGIFEKMIEEGIKHCDFHIAQKYGWLKYYWELSKKEK